MTTTTTTVREGGFKMSWGAVFAGSIVTLGLWLLLHLLGMAAGLTAIDPQDQGSLRGIGIGTGVWSVIAPLLALFGGGYVASRTAGLVDRVTGGIHGAVVWGLTALVGSVLLTMLVSSTLRAGMNVAQAGFGAVAGAGASAAQGGGLQALGVRTDDLLTPVNQRLAQQGLPPVTPEKLEATMRDGLRQAVTTGELDRNTMMNSLVRNTGISQSEAQQLMGRVEQRFNEQKQELRQGALTAADRAGKAMWAMFFALLLGLGAATGGAILGSHKRAEVVVEQRPSPAGPRHVPVESHT